MSAAPSQSVQDDLRMMRELAEEGRTRPLLGGREFVIFGCAIAIASLLQVALMEGLLAWPPMALAAIWFGTMMLAVILARATRSASITPTTANRVEIEVWRVGGFVIGAIALSILAHAMIDPTPRGFFLFTLLPPIVFGVYAIAMAASCAAARDTTLRKYAVLSIVFLVMTTLLAGSVEQYLAMAIGAILVSIVPGLELMKRERANRG